MPKINLKELFLDLQQELAATLQVNRKHVPHPTLKGDATELEWVKMLQKYLPERYRVERACVLDTDGNLSDQIDVVIFDQQYCPLLFNHGGALYVPSESVYAVFEVKQTFSKAWIEYAGEKAASVRNLRRTSVAIPHAGGTFPPKAAFSYFGGFSSTGQRMEPGFRTAAFRNTLRPRER